MELKELTEKLLERRVILLTGDVTTERIDAVRGHLLQLNVISNEEIKVVIDTKGGDCEPGFWLVDLVQTLNAPVTGIVTGECYSTGVAILQGCRKRLATPHSWFQVHFVSGTFRYTHREKDLMKKFELRVARTQKVQEQTFRLLSSRTGKSLEEITALCEKGENCDWKFDASEAKELGFIDEIVENFQLFPRP